MTSTAMCFACIIEYNSEKDGDGNVIVRFILENMEQFTENLDFWPKSHS